jgi:hypothetical protein
MHFLNEVIIIATVTQTAVASDTKLRGFYTKLRQKFTKKRIIILAIVLTCCLVVAPLSYNRYVQYMIDISQLTINTINLTGSTGNVLNCTLELCINNPAPADAVCERTKLDIYYGKQKLGYTVLDKIKLRSGDNKITYCSKLYVQHLDVLSKLAQDLMVKPKLTFRAKGDIVVSPAGGLAFMKSYNTLDKLVHVRGMQNLTTNIHILELTSYTEETITVSGTISITNPSSFIIDLSTSRFELVYNSHVLSTFSMGNYILTQGTNIIRVDMEIQKDAISIAGDALSNILNGNDVTFIVRGASPLHEYTGDNLLFQKLMSYFECEVKLEGVPGFEISFNRMTFLNATETYIKLETEKTVSNPTPLMGKLGEITFDMFYEDKKIAEITYPSLALRPGTRKYVERGILTTTTPKLLGKFLSEVLAGEPVTITICGSPTADTLFSQLLVNFEHPIVLESMGKSGIILNKLHIIDATTDTIQLEVNATLANPSILEGDLPAFELAIEYKDERLGSITTMPIELNKGLNEVHASGVLQPTDAALLRDMVTQHLYGEEVEFVLTGVEHTIDGRADNNLLTRVFSYVTLKTTLAGVSDKMSMEVNKLELINITEDTLVTRAYIDLYNPSSFEGNFGKVTFEVNYNGKAWGKITTELTEFPTGHSSIVTIANLTPTSSTQFKQVMTHIMSGTPVVLNIRGDFEADELVSKMLADYEVNLTLDAKGVLEIVPEAIYLLENNNDKLTFSVISLIHNPTMFAIRLDLLNYDILYEGQYIGSEIIPDSSLIEGKKRIVSTMTIVAADEDAAQAMFVKYISGEDVNMTVVAYIPEFIFDRFVLFETNLTLEGMGSLKLSISHLHLLEWVNDIVNLTMTWGIYNPLIFAGKLGTVAFEVYYQATMLGILETYNITIEQGQNNLLTEGTLYLRAQDVFHEVFQQLMDGMVITLTLRGNPNAYDMFSRILSTWSTDVSLEPDGSVEMIIENILFVDSTPEHLTMVVDYCIVNPCPLSTEPQAFTGSVYYQNELLGEMTTSPAALKPGENFGKGTCVLTTANTALGSEMMCEYLNGNDIILKYVGTVTTDTSGISLFELEINLPCWGYKLTMELIDLTFIKAETDFLVTEVRVRISNPTVFEGDVGTVLFDTYYLGELVGTFEIANFTINHGTYDLLLTSILTPTNPQLLTTMISDLFTGLNADLLIRGADDSEHILGRFLAGYETTITIYSTGALQINILSIDVVAGLEDAIVLSVDCTITNPTTMSANLSELHFDMIHEGEKVGDFIMPPTFIIPGVNHLTTLNTLSGNMTHISRILSDYIMKKNTTFTIQGNKTYDHGILAKVLMNWSQEVVLPGVTEDLIEAVHIDNIYIVLSGINIGFYADTTATVHNPTDFDLNVTYAYYDIYFDDDDGCPLYPEPKYNIYVDSIALDFTLEPLSIEAHTSINIQASLSNNTSECAFRLNDEYNNDNDLYVDAIGYMIVNIGEFYCKIYFEVYDIYVPNE